MAQIASLEMYLWPITMLLALGLAVLLVYRQKYKGYPFFFAYILSTLIQNTACLLSYEIWGFYSTVSFKVGWGTQAFVTIARTLAVAEICLRVLAKYRGIWGLGWRLFVAAGVTVLAYSSAIGRHSLQLVAVTADRSLEMAM